MVVAWKREVRKALMVVAWKTYVDAVKGSIRVWGFNICCSVPISHG
jgi:hypothetical protein